MRAFHLTAGYIQSVGIGAGIALHSTFLIVWGTIFLIHAAYCLYREETK